MSFSLAPFLIVATALLFCSPEVCAGETQSTYDQIHTVDSHDHSLTDRLKAYQKGSMSQSERVQFENDVAMGLIVLPPRVKVGGAARPVPSSAFILPTGAIDAYNLGATNPYDRAAMPDSARRAMDSDLADGTVALPPGAVLNRTYRGFFQNVSASFSGSTIATDAVKDSLSNLIGDIANGGILLVGFALVSGCAYLVWKIARNAVLYLSNLQMRMELERRQLEKLRAATTTTMRNSDPA